MTLLLTNETFNHYRRFDGGFWEGRAKIVSPTRVHFTFNPSSV